MSDRKELPTVDRCETCRFWKEWLVKSDELHAGRGDCRRYPPVAISPVDDEEGVQYAQPHTLKDEWCGEWKPIPEQIPTVAPPPSAG